MAYTFKHGDRPLEGVTIQRAVGRGGFGEVYYAVMDSGKQVAVKYLRDNPEVELRGIAHVMNLKSPHLITIYDVRRNEHEEPFVMMEYVSGPSLRELLSANPDGLGAQKAAFFLMGIAKGLNYLHERGIVHRDLKPANIFYDDGYVKIGDYGLSKHMSVSRHSAQTVSVGTVHYMAPEIGSGNYSKAIDIYALGVMLHEMLTGRLPFTGSSMAEILMKHVNERPNLIGLPEPFASVIGKALVKDPGGRWQDVNEMVDALTRDMNVSESISSFDPNSLSHVPRDPNASDPDRTHTRSPHRAPLPPLPPLDLGAIGRAAPHIPPLPGEPMGRQAARRAERLRRKIELHAARAERISHRLQSKVGWKPEREARRVESPKRFPHMLTLIFVLTGIAIGLGLLSDERMPEAAVACGLLMAGAVVGVLTGHFAIVERNTFRHAMLDRMVYGGATALGLIPGAVMAGEELGDRFAMLMVPLVAMMVLTDPARRIESGRRLQVSGEALFWPGVIGLVTTLMVNDNHFAWVAAGLCAAVAFLMQVAAGLWPFQRTAPPPGPSRGPQPERDAAPPTSDEAAERRPASWPADESPPPGGPPIAQSPHVVAMDLDQPSFAGRSVRAGLSFTGKLLLLASVVVAFASHSTSLEIMDGRDGLRLRDGTVMTWEPGKQAVAHIPTGAMLVPLGLGIVLIMLARRGDGWAHVTRGLLAGLLVGGAVLVALGPAGNVLELSIHDEVRHLQVQHYERLFVLGGFLLLSLFVVLWPRRRAPVQRPMML